MHDVVLDASAVLAQLRSEPGADRVSAQLSASYLSTVNLAEVVQKLVSDGASDEGIGEVLAQLPCEIVVLDEAMAVRAGLLRRATRAQGLSIGDRACLALAERLRLPAFTADRAWAELDLGIEVVLIR